MVYINKKNTKHLEKDNIGKRGGGGPTMSLDAFEFLFLDSAREASNADISRTAMVFENEISLHEVTKSINSQTNNESSMA